MAQKVFGITIGKDNDNPKKPKKGEKPAEKQPLVTSWKPTIPQINALPISILDKYESKELIKKFVVGAMVVVIITALVFAAQMFSNINHQNSMDQLAVEKETINSQIQQLQPYQTYKTSVSEKMTTLSTYLASDVDIAQVFNIMYSSAAANEIKFNDLSIAISEQGAEGSSSGCVQTDPFTSTPTIGCIIFSGSQPSPDALRAFFEVLQNQEGFVDAFLGSASYSSGEQASENSFEGSIAFTSFFYSQKYTNLTLAIDTIIEGGGLEQAQNALESGEIVVEEETPEENTDGTETGETNE